MGPDVYADVVPLEMELIDPDQRVGNKSYTKRYDKEELKWYINSLKKANIIQKATTTGLSQANLIEKFKDGVAMLDDHRMVRTQQECQDAPLPFTYRLDDL